MRDSTRLQYIFIFEEGNIIMDKFIEKLSSYNLLNNLLPGAVVYILLDKMLSFSNQKINVMEELFLFYFVGMIASRMGSIIIEPICKKIKFVQYAEYNDYLDAIKIDSNIATLLESNNMYRTFLSGMILILLIKVYLVIVAKVYTNESFLQIAFFFALVVLFAFSYRKQTSYIKRRVEKVIQRK